MTRRTLQILVVVLSLGFAGGVFFRIYHLSSDANSGSNRPYPRKNTANRTSEGVTPEVSAKSNNGSGKRATESSKR